MYVCIYIKLLLLICSTCGREGNTENENETDQLFNLQFLPQQTAQLTIVAYKSANIHMWCVTISEHYQFNAKHAVKLKIKHLLLEVVKQPN